ncbi:MAG TPA: hypothetical protein VG735_06630, partial [Caulobacterales bacterium]|nr:hypothetical protein [Caulobacterales bacterium]
ALAFVRWAGWIVGGALVLMLPVFVNGRVFPFTDSATYFQSGYHTLRAIFVGVGLPISEFSRAYLAARSPYYGVAITGLEWIGTLWLIVLVNALGSAILLRATARILDRARVNAIYAALIVGLTLVSALPLFVGFIMPDITAAFEIMAIGLLVFYPTRLTLGEKALLWTTIAAALAFHPTHGMIALFVAPAALGLRLLMKQTDVLRRGAIVGSAMVVGMAAWAVFAAANNASAKPQYSPPFVMARLLADGPGATYLRHACAENPKAYALCAFKDLKFVKSDEILWSWRKDKGVFAVADTNTRLALIHESTRFAVNAVLHDPVGVTRAALKNFGLQLISVGVDEGFRLDAHYWMTYPPDFYLRNMAIRAHLCSATAKTCPARLPLEAIHVWHYITTALAALYLAAWYYLSLSGPAARNDSERRLFMAFGAVLIFGVVINAAVCGVISGPFARYQARVAWLLPALAIVAEMRFAILAPLYARFIPARRADPD